MEDIYNPFSSLLEMKIETEKPIDTYEHESEDSARNRMFLWKFASDELKTFVGIFETYNKRPDTKVSREALSNSLRDQCAKMLRARCLPVECMLYASKVSNARMHDKLTDILAARIHEVYRSRGDQTAEVLDVRTYLNIVEVRLVDQWRYAQPAAVPCHLELRVLFVDILCQLVNAYGVGITSHE